MPQPFDVEEFRRRVTTVEERIRRSLERAGRQGEPVEIVAVTKAHPVEAVEAALAAGLLHLGESKVQEARGKMETVGRGVWHLIGHLQSNKAKVAARIFQRIDSVDSIALADDLSKHADGAGTHLQVLLQVNMAGESQKFGLSPDRTSAAAEALNALPRLELIGLMTMAPYVANADDARPTFSGLRELRDRLERELGLHLPVLSMGMSHDFEAALAEGATSIRLGTLLFGPRQSPLQPRTMGAGDAI
jgi:hypothetical protein